MSYTSLVSLNKIESLLKEQNKLLRQLVKALAPVEQQKDIPKEVEDKVNDRPWIETSP